mgnify:CR=1 FL=1
MSLHRMRAVGGRPTGERLERMERSSNWQGGRFVNELAKQQGGILPILWRMLRNSAPTVPDEELPVVTRGAEVLAEPPPGGLRVTWLGHSTSLVELDGYRVLVDPVWSDRASPFDRLGPERFHPVPLALEDLPPVDAVVISHDHYDHLDHRTIDALVAGAAEVGRYVVPLGVGAHLESWGVEPGDIVELDWWQDHRIGDLTLTATPARHFSGRSPLMLGQDRTLWAGWALAGPRHRVFFSGDTAMFPGFREIGRRLGPFDVLLMEAGAYDELWADVHIGPEQAIEAATDLGGGLVIPVHWGTFDLALHAWTEPIERLLVAAEEAGLEVAVPRPGESVVPGAGPVPTTRWWPEVAWKTAGEAPLVSSGLEPAATPSQDPPSEPRPALELGS